MKKALIIVVMIAFACTEQLEVIPYTYPQIISGTEKKGWTIRSFQYTEEGKAPQTGQLPDCLEDDLYIFFANAERRIEIRDGHDKCDPADPDLIAEGTWSFKNSGATLTMPFPLLGIFTGYPFILREAEEDRMTIEIFFDENNKSSYRFNFRVADLE